MQKKVGIVQSNYIPWRGYFDFIAYVDEFILFDDVQYTKRDWRNRNLIKTSNGPLWLTIPVLVKGKYFQPINETKVLDSKWCSKHLNTLKHNYSNAPYFDLYFEELQELYKKAESIEFLSEINHLFILYINKLLGINTPVKFSSDYGTIDGKNERLLDLCIKAEGTTYVSGPSAKNYLNETIFEEKSLKVEWMNYNGYSEYDQLHGNFDPFVSVLDLIFNKGSESGQYLKFV